MDIALVTETKLTHDMYSHQDHGYTITATKAQSAHQGGIAILARADATDWHLKGTRTHGPNVMSCVLVQGTRRKPIIGAYLPPGDLEDLPYIIEALQRYPEPPILLGDLNVMLDDPSDNRNNEVADTLAGFSFIDMLPLFWQRRKYRSLATWRQWRDRTLIRSRCDYIMVTDHHLFQNVRLTQPRHYISDHLMVTATL